MQVKRSNRDREEQSKRRKKEEDERRRREGEKWGEEIKAKWLEEGEEEWGMAGGGGTDRIRGEGGGWANFINEEMSEEQRQKARPLSEWGPNAPAEKNIHWYTAKKKKERKIIFTNSIMSTKTTEYLFLYFDKMANVLSAPFSLHQKPHFLAFSTSLQTVNGVLLVHLACGWPPVSRKNKLIPGWLCAKP